MIEGSRRDVDASMRSGDGEPLLEPVEERGPASGFDTNPDEMSGAGSIGFDLDMTLVDSRLVSQRALERLVSEYGAELDVSALMLEYGLPLSRWLPADVDRSLFRMLQSQDIALARPMLGAQAALAAVRRTADRIVVVTSAPLPIADGMLRASGLRIDRLRSGVWGADKAEPLREERCWGFVGDHADDMLAARVRAIASLGTSAMP